MIIINCKTCFPGEKKTEGPTAVSRRSSVGTAPVTGSAVMLPFLLWQYITQKKTKLTQNQFHNIRKQYDTIIKTNVTNKCPIHYPLSIISTMLSRNVLAFAHPSRHSIDVVPCHSHSRPRHRPHHCSNPDYSLAVLELFLVDL